MTRSCLRWREPFESKSPNDRLCRARDGEREPTDGMALDRSPQMIHGLFTAYPHAAVGMKL